MKARVIVPRTHLRLVGKIVILGSVTVISIGFCNCSSVWCCNVALVTVNVAVCCITVFQTLFGVSGFYLYRYCNMYYFITGVGRVVVWSRFTWMSARTSFTPVLNVIRWSENTLRCKQNRNNAGSISNA